MVSSAVIASNVGVSISQLSMILANLTTEICNFSNMFLALQKLIQIIPGFHLYILEINSKHQSSFPFSLKVELILLLAMLKGLKSFRWYFLMFANNCI